MRGEDRRERVGAVNHHESPAGREDREAGSNPVRERRPRLRRREDMRPRAPCVRRGANRPALEERRVGDDAIGRFVGKPGLPALSGLQDIEPEDARAPFKSVARGIDLGKPGELRIDLDEIGERPRGPPDERQPDRADARADVDDPALRRPRCRGEQRRVGADPMAAPRLDEGEPAAEPPVLGKPVRDRQGSRARATASTIAQLSGEARLGDRAARPSLLARIDQNPPRQEAERSLDGGHVLVGDEKRDPLRLQNRFDDADENEIVGAQDFDQGGTPIGSLAASFTRLYGRGAASGKGMRPWELSFRSKKSRPTA